MAETSHVPSSTTRISSRITAGLLAAVLVWGVYLAIGAVLFNRDLRKGFIVFGCTAAFLGLWGLTLWFRQKSAGSTENTLDAWNRASLTSFVASLISLACMASAALPVLPPTAGIYRWVLITALISGIVGGIAALVGLSSPVRRGRGLGLIALLLLVICAIAGWAVSPV